MYRAVIADDEPHIIEGLKIMFDWAASGFEVVETASNGIEAYEKITELCPDLVIIDIKMPGYDGLELSKRLRENGYRGGIIILTGYAEIDYAREGIKYDVKYFLDKPVDNKELKNALLDFKNEFDRINRRKNFVSGAAVKLAPVQSGNYSRWCVVSAKLKNPIDVSGLPDGIRLYEYGLGVQSYAISGGDDIESVVNLLFERILEINPEAIACAAYCDSEDEIKTCYASAVNSLMRIVKPVSGTLYTAAEYQAKEAEIVNFPAFVKQLTEYMEFGDGDAVKKCIDVFFDALTEESNPMIYAQMLYSYVTMYADSAAASADEGAKRFSEKNVIVGLSDYRDRVAEMCAEIMETIAETDISSDERIFDMAKRYIEEHFREDILIKDIASVVYTSPGYLGALFTKENGMSIKNYIHNLRLNEAERLMRTGDKSISDIAFEVGYNNYNHFYTQFMRRFGMPPATYKKSLDKN